MPIVDIKGETVHYVSSGAGDDPVLLLIHGSGGDHAHWPETVLGLSGARVYALDLPGHGKSSGPGRQRVADYAAVVSSFVDRLRLSGVTVAGHSLGGAIAQALALEAPSWLSRIVLVGTGARLRVAPAILDKIMTDPVSAADLLVQWAFGPTASEAQKDKFRQGLLQTDPAVTHGDFFACDRFDIMDRVGEINIPVLVVSADLDRLTPLKYGKFLNDRIPGATMTVIRGAGHMMALEKPGALIRALSRFLQIPGNA